MKYLGWIPNLRGRLSFSAIGTSTKPYPFKKSTKSEFIIVSHDRFLNDSAIPRFIRQILFTCRFSPFRIIFLMMFHIFSFFKKYAIGKLLPLRLLVALFASSTIEKLLFHSGDFQFIFIQDSKSSDEEIILGKVFVTKSTFSLNKVLCIQGENSTYSQMEQILKGSSIVHASIELPRNGILSIDDVWFEEIKQDKLRWITKTDGFSYEKFKDDAVSQVYYFMKDLCHQHQHHDSKSDILLPLVKDNSQNSYKELTNEVLKSLYRTILKMRRTHSEDDYYSMKGMMAYVTSFKEIMSQKTSLRTTINAFSASGDEKIISSIEAKAGALGAYRERKNKYTSLIPSILSLCLATLGILLAFSSVIILSFARTDDNFATEFRGKLPSNYLDYVIQILNHPLEILVILSAILLLIFWLVSPHFNEYRTRNDFMRLSYGFKNKYILGTLIILCSIITIYYSFTLMNFGFTVELMDKVKSTLYEYSILLFINITLEVIDIIFS